MQDVSMDNLDGGSIKMGTKELFDWEMRDGREKKKRRK